MRKMAIETSELNKLQYAAFPQIFEKLRTMAAENQGMPMSAISTAFAGINAGRYGMANPYIQNRRVKQISSLPVNFTKDKVGEMLTAPYDSEQPLRQVSHILEYTAYPLFHIRKTYQNLLTYHSYVMPRMVSGEDTKKDDFLREWKLTEKLREEFKPKENAHQIVGQVGVEGKVFYYPRYSVDKSHNKVNYAFMQQLPSDWTKITGYNNVSKYTVAFNMMYFLQPGCVPEQFGELFLPYLYDFGSVVQKPEGTGTSVVFAQKTRIDMQKFQRIQAMGDMPGTPDVYYQNGRWYYWVYLPVDSIFPFEADDVSRTAISPFAGLFLNMIQLAQMEQIQLELIQNPLVSLLHGEIPYRDDKAASSEDQYKLSNAGRLLFEAIWYDMLQANNTSGIGLYLAPAENMKLESLSEAPSAMDIVKQGYSDTMSQAGMGAIIPLGDDPKAGTAQISLQIESKFMQTVYRDFERMMNAIIKKLNLKYDWKFVMFGDIAEDEKTLERCMNGMEHGILPDTILYNALLDRSMLDDLCLSDAVFNSGILDKRLPLVTAYNMKQDSSGLPPQSPGRPKGDGNVTADGSETMIDQYGGTND
nr:MAG TPA: portal protein [Caudoviricetes sp.]